MDNWNNNQPMARDHANREDNTAVVSGSDIFDSSDDEEESEFESESERNVHNNSSSSNNNPKRNKYGISKIDELYNPNGDDEDEAYVYRHLRGGIEESVNVSFPSKSQSDVNEVNFPNSSSKKDADADATETETANTTETETETANTTKTQQQQPKSQSQSQSQGKNQYNQNYNIMEQAKILKPRNSDGILSCPCCFQTVCMDCQKHETYSNQFRAMFVMNIGVDWSVTVSTTTSTNHNHKSRFQQQQPQQQGNSSNDIQDNIDGTNYNSLNSKLIVPTDEEHKKKDDGIYYSVYCNNCHTQVAALDMRDEVYHFFGCIVSG